MSLCDNRKLQLNECPCCSERTDKFTYWTSAVPLFFLSLFFKAQKHFLSITSRAASVACSTHPSHSGWLALLLLLRVGLASQDYRFAVIWDTADYAFHLMRPYTHTPHDPLTQMDSLLLSPRFTVREWGVEMAERLESWTSATCLQKLVVKLVVQTDFWMMDWELIFGIIVERRRVCGCVCVCDLQQLLEGTGNLLTSRKKQRVYNPLAFCTNE